MKHDRLVVGLAASVLLCSAGGVAAQGPDAVVASVFGPLRHPVVGDTISFSIGITTCNLGDAELAWDRATNQHPVLVQNIFRLADGRLEQIGMSWGKHGFCAVSFSGCGPCIASGCDTLGVNCSDPYDAGVNGSQGGLGPRSIVNPSTGAFVYSPSTWPPSGGELARRIQVQTNDILPSQNPGALYFGEGLWITVDESSTNRLNNASHVRMTFTEGTFAATQGSTFQREPAITAWREFGNGIGVPDPDVQIETVDVVNDGRFYVASNVIDEPGDAWRYEYGVYNYHSDRAAGEFTVPIPAGVTVTDAGFKDIDYHSNEVYDNTDWTVTVGPDSVTWSCPSTFESDPNTNALRWGTMYNFWFTADVGPAEGDVTLGLFKPGQAGDPSSVVSPAQVPEASVPCACDLTGDGTVAVNDLLAYLTLWFDLDPAADETGDGAITVADLLAFLVCFFDGCP